MLALIRFFAEKIEQWEDELGQSRTTHGSFVLCACMKKNERESRLDTPVDLVVHEGLLEMESILQDVTFVSKLFPGIDGNNFLSNPLQVYIHDRRQNVERMTSH